MMSLSRVSRNLAVPLAILAAVGCSDQVSTPTAPRDARLAESADIPPTLAAAPVGNARFARLNTVDVAVGSRTAGAVLAVAGAAPGTLVRSFNAANPSNCSVQTGIAFDGTNLLMSCWYNQYIDVLKSTDGTLVKRLNVPSLSGGIYALAWDAGRNRLWACTNASRVSLIDTSDPNGDGIVEPGEVQSRFSTGGCYDGLAFDGADKTLWYSSDVESYVHHVDSVGTVLGGPYYVAGILGTGNSGIAAGGGNLYLANNGNSQIYVTNKPPTSGTLFATFPRRIEDMECDDITFSADGIAVIWQQDAYDRNIQAYAIAPGACPFGGSVAPQTVMDVQPNTISVGNSAVVNVILISTALFDATAANLDNVRFVVNGNPATSAPVAKRGAAYISSTADWNHDGRPDRMVVFTMASLRAAGLTAGATNFHVEDVTSASNKFQAYDTVLPTLVP